MGKLDCGVGPASGLDDRTRDACLHTLGDHYAAGRLTAQELDSRIQVVLGAETEADLTEVMADLETEGDQGSDGSSRRSREPGGTPTTPVVRWVVGLLVVVAGGVVLALLGPGPAVAELAVGLTAGLLGYLTHWWLTRRPAPPTPATERRTATAPRPLVLKDEEWRPEDSDEAVIDATSPPAPVARLRSTRPLGRGNGVMPTQRTGD